MDKKSNQSEGALPPRLVVMIFVLLKFLARFSGCFIGAYGAWKAIELFKVEAYVDSFLCVFGYGLMACAYFIFVHAALSQAQVIVGNKNFDLKTDDDSRAQVRSLLKALLLTILSLVAASIIV